MDRCASRPGREQPAAGHPFDAYCDEHGIKPGEEPAAFAAWLHEISGGKWDGQMERVDSAPEAALRDRIGTALTDAARFDAISEYAGCDDKEKP
jgi:hypothetical protein